MNCKAVADCQLAVKDNYEKAMLYRIKMLEQYGHLKKREAFELRKAIKNGHRVDVHIEHGIPPRIFVNIRP